MSRRPGQSSRRAGTKIVIPSAGFTPSPGSTLKLWLRADSYTNSGANITQMTDLSGNGNHYTPVSGGVSPTIISSSAIANGKPAWGYTHGGSSQGFTNASFALTQPCTVYVAAADTSGLTSTYRWLFSSVTSGLRLYIDATATPQWVFSAGVTASTLLPSVATPTVLTTVVNTTSTFAQASQTVDYSGNAGGQGVGNAVLGDSYLKTGGLYGWGGEIYEVLVFNVAHTLAEQLQYGQYLASRYGFSFDADPTGVIAGSRYKLAFDTSTSATYPNAPQDAANYTTATGQQRLYARRTPKRDAMPTASYPFWDTAQDNTNTGPWSARMPDGYATIRAAGTDYKTVLTTGWDQAKDVETFTVIGGGIPPEYYVRVDSTKAWVQLPFDSPGNIASLAGATGNVGLCGNSQTTPNAYFTHPTSAVVREFYAMQDGAYPPSCSATSYVTGSLVFAGDSLSSMLYGAGTAYYAVQGLAPGAFPKPRQTGVPGQTITQLSTGFTAQVGTYYASGGTKNIAVLWIGRNSLVSISGSQCWTDLQSLINTAKTAGFSVVVGTIMSSSGVSDSERATLNSSITSNAASIGYAVADISGNANLGANGASANTTYFADGIHLTGTGAKIAGALFATAVNSLL